MAENFLPLVTLQENSKTGKDHEVIINFLCTPCIMIDRKLNIFCLVMEMTFSQKNENAFLKIPLGKAFFVLS